MDSVEVFLDGVTNLVTGVDGGVPLTVELGGASRFRVLIDGDVILRSSVIDADVSNGE